jgi:hypothetical protein
MKCLRLLRKLRARKGRERRIYSSMNLTNTYNLPDSIFNAIKKDSYIKVGDYSATGLIKPPQMVALESRHSDKITEDASDGLWRLLGEAVHYVLEKGGHVDAISEARLQITVGDKIVSCKPDLYHIGEKSIDDYKVTSAYSFILGDKPEWEQQLNINAAIYRENGFPVERLRIFAILRDFMRSKTLSDPEYPRIPFQTVEIPIWEHEGALHFIKVRVGLHELAKSLPDNALLPCTDAERWMRPTTYAVMKEGRKSAVRVLDTMEAAKEILAVNVNSGKGAFSIETRKGEAIRCNGYCLAAPFCCQLKACPANAE